jgi:Protein of unknown function (DUF732)
VSAVQSSDPNGIPDKTLVGLGEAVCHLLENGKSVSYVDQQLSTGDGGQGQGFPAQFVSVLIRTSPRYFCPRNLSEVERWAGSGTGGGHASSTARPSGHASTTERTSKSAGQSPAKVLSSLLPVGVRDCSEGTSTNVPGLAGLVSTTTCQEPNLGSDSFVHGYIFDNASDYQTSITAYNNWKGLLPFTPGVGCPTTNDTDNGTVGWKDKAFPARSDQVLECTMVAADSNSSTNNVPDYVWTVPSKFVILEAGGDPGSTMQHLDTWWSDYADTN